MAKDKPKIEARLLKGFRDYDPKQQARRQDIFRLIQTIFERFGFLPLATPALEYKEILLGKYGEGEKLLYAFKDNGDRDVALRYDLTVPLARYVAQNQNTLVFPFKRYQIAPVWRADNPQKGRFREFYQCDIDVVMGSSPASDAEVVACACQALQAVGITNYEVRLNDRKIFDLVSNYFLASEGKTAEAPEIMRTIDKFDKVGRDGVMQELAEKNISPVGQKQAQMLMDLGRGTEALDKLQSSLPQDSGTQVVDSLRLLIDLIVTQGIDADKIIFDPLIVRGLDYYTGAVFEIILKDKPEFGSVAAGGRYDNLVDQFSAVSLPAVGISIGVDRLFDALTDLELMPATGLVDVLVMNLEDGLMIDYVKLVSELRAGGINSEIYYEPTKLDKQFKYAESKNTRYAVIMGNDELNRGVVQIKNLQTRQQQELKREDLLAALK